MIKSMLTTIDNPFDPFDDFDNWYTYDESRGYHSCSLLANFLSNDLMINVSDKIKNYQQEQAIDKIIKTDPLNLYTKVQRDVEEKYVTESKRNLDTIAV